MFKKLLGTLAVRNKQEKERNANRTGERELTFVCLWYDSIQEKKTKASPKIVKTSRWIQENYSKQNQYAKVSNTLDTSDKLPKSNSFKTVTGACLVRKSHPRNLYFSIQNCCLKWTIAKFWKRNK